MYICRPSPTPTSIKGYIPWSPFKMNYKSKLTDGRWMITQNLAYNTESHTYLKQSKQEQVKKVKQQSSFTLKSSNIPEIFLEYALNMPITASGFKPVWEKCINDSYIRMYISSPIELHHSWSCIMYRYLKLKAFFFNSKKKKKTVTNL